MLRDWIVYRGTWYGLFQWAPTLGGECYQVDRAAELLEIEKEFLWAPTLGGECYREETMLKLFGFEEFQWAPTLGGECYYPSLRWICTDACISSFNGHPPLGVNATV